MVKINGVEAVSTKSLKKSNVQPSLNEILDRLEKQNFNAINNIKAQSQLSDFDSSENTKTANTSNENINIVEGLSLNNSDNLLLSVLPSLLSMNKSNLGIKNSKDMIFKQMLKNTNNPRLAQIIELIPKLMKPQSTNSQEISGTITDIPKIDSFVKTDDYV